MIVLSVVLILRKLFLQLMPLQEGGQLGKLCNPKMGHKLFNVFKKNVATEKVASQEAGTHILKHTCTKIAF